MIHKFKYHSLRILFNFISDLTDTSGGWKILVYFKITLGILLLSQGLGGCKKTASHSEKHITKQHPSLDTISEKTTTNKTTINQDPKLYFREPIVSCYDTDVVIKDSTESGKKTSPANNVTDTTVYHIVNEMPEFQGGDSALIQFINKNLRYPLTESCVQGRVICQFIVNIDGSISDINVLRSLDPYFDREALRVISLFPKLIPGKLDGKTVRCYFVLPISFRIQ